MTIAQFDPIKHGKKGNVTYGNGRHDNDKATIRTYLPRREAELRKILIHFDAQFKAFGREDLMSGKATKPR